MSVFVRPFEKDDITAFEPIEPIPQGEEFTPELAQLVEDSSLAVTGIRDGKIWGCGGVHPLSDGHGEMWLRLGKDCLNHRLDTLRWLREGLKIIEEVYPFKQLNATIRCSFKQGIKLIKFLGLHQTEIRIHEGHKWYIFSKRVKE